MSIGLYIIMNRVINKNYMYNLELQSLHYWYKRVVSQNPSIKYNNILKIMKDSIYEADIIITNTQNITSAIQRPHIAFHDRIILKNIFEHWKIYVIHKLHTRRAMYKADFFYRTQLQKKVFNTLSKNVLLKWKHIVSSMYNCTNKFTISVNDVKADARNTKLLLKQYFTYWRKYVTIKHRKRTLLEEAIAHHNLYCLKKYIANWKMYTIKQTKKKVLQDKIDKAREFYTKSILRKYIKVWIRICEFTIQKFKIQSAILHYENRLLKKYLRTWKVYHDLKIQKLNMKEYVQEYTKKKLLKQYFELFVMRINESIIDKRKKMFLTQNFYEKKLKMKCLRKLCSYAVYKKEKKIKLSYLHDKSEAIIRQLQIIYLEKWRSALYFTVQEKRKLHQVIKFWELNLTRKYFSYWKEFSQQYKIKTVRKEKFDELASGFLLKECISHWHAKLQLVLEVRKKEMYVISVREHKVMKKCLSSWKEYIIRKMKTKNDIEAAKKLHKQFFLRDGLKKILRNSLRNIDYQYNMQVENAAMRSLENYEILKEYFDKWYSMIYLKYTSTLLHEVAINDFQFAHSQTSCNNILDSVKNTWLVLPEYMKKKSF